MAPKNGTHYTAVDTPPKVLLGVDADGVPTWGDTRTKQSEAAATNINTIVKQYDRTGILPEGGREALYLDVSAVPDYRSALDQVNLADEMFMQLPADLRARFENDAAVFLDWTSQEENRDEMVELGMLPKPEVAPDPIRVVIDPPPVVPDR